MKSACYLLALIFLVSCATSPAIHIPPLVETTAKINCGVIYPQGKWQFVHFLEFSLANGKKGSAVGVTVINDPVIECALMTVEGFVLFEARYDKELKIIRAVSPFDNEEFAQGLIRDLQLIFFPLSAEDIQYGKNSDDSRLCRYTKSNGQCLDVVLSADHGWQIQQYEPDKVSGRTITAKPQAAQTRQWLPPRNLQLTAYGTVEYTLQMTLISAEKM
jgi:hypothetical protein